MYNTDTLTPTEENARDDWQTLTKFRGFKKGEAFTIDGYEVTIQKFALNHAWVRFPNGESAMRSYAELVAGKRAPHRPIVGERVRLTTPIDRFPHFRVDAGATGVVAVSDENMFAVKMDETIDGAEEWDNEIVWMPEDMQEGESLHGDVEAA